MRMKLADPLDFIDLGLVPHDLVRGRTDVRRIVASQHES